MQSFFARLVPFIFLGIFIVLFVVGTILLSYLLIFGALVGLVIFVVAWLRDLIVKNKKPMIKSSKRGRTIDQK